MRRLTLALTAAAIALSPAPASAQATLDAKVTGLNDQVFAVLRKHEQRRVGFLDLAGAQDVAAAIALDGKVDPVERDLLAELTQTNFYNVTVTRANAVPGEIGVMLYPSAGEPKQVLFLAIDPVLETIWASSHHGFGHLLAKAATDRAHVKAYMVLKLTAKANESNMANRYKPFRDLVGELYADAAIAQGSDAAAGRALLHEAAKETDRAVADKLPDFLYNWVNPAAS